MASLGEGRAGGTTQATTPLLGDDAFLGSRRDYCLSCSIKLSGVVSSSHNVSWTILAFLFWK